MATHRHFETQTGLLIDIQISKSKTNLMYLVIDGEIYILKKSDAGRIATNLIEISKELE